MYIGRRPAPFKILLEAERSYSVFGDIAVDDVSLSNCALPPVQSRCRYYQFTCARKSCISNNRVCDYTDDCGDRSDETNCYNYKYRCTFQYSTCAWRQEKNSDNFDWTRNRGTTASYQTGPMFDHTYGTASGKGVAK